MSTVMTLIPIILLALVAVLALVGALKGLSRGISRQIIRTITVIASAVISFFISKGTYTGIMNALEGKTMEDIITWLNEKNLAGGADISWLANLDMETVELLLTLPLALIIMPLIFVMAFVLISALMLIIHAILCALFGLSKRRNTALTKVLGMALGLIQGLAVAGIILMPIVGISATVEQSVTILNEEAPEEKSTASLNDAYNKYIKAFSENAAVKSYGTLGVKALYKSIATVDIDGEKFDTTLLIPDVATVTVEAMQLKGCDFKKLTPENESNVDSIIRVVEEDEYLKRVAAGVVKTAGHFFEAKGSTTFKLGEPIDSILLTAMKIFTTTDSTTVVADFKTIRDVYFTLSRDGILLSFDQGSDALLSALTQRDAEGNTTVNKVITTINQNERTKPLTTLITQISISVISKQTGIDESTVQTYDNVISGINAGAIKIDKSSYSTEAEYVSAVSNSLDTTLKENNINVEPEIVDEMAQYIADNYSDKDEITNEEANDIILSYYDAYLKKQ